MVPKKSNFSKRPIDAVGVVFYCRNTNRVLYLLRNAREQVWCLPGGKIERGETILAALERECREEIGVWPNSRMFPLDCFRSPDGKFCYHTFFSVVDQEFLANLNHEHLAFAWCKHGSYPRPLHTGLLNTLNHSTILEKIQIILDSQK